MNVVFKPRLHPVSALLAVALLSGPVMAQNAAAPAPKPEDTQEVVMLPEFSVSTAKDDSFVATESTSGTRVATEIINLPFSVSVLTEDFVREFQLFDLDEQAPFFSGMAAGDPAQGGGGGTRLRGFSVPYFRNGFYRSQAPDSNSIARTEVVKGPQSAIYGRVSPGGVVNYISKKPGRKFASEFSYVFGTYDYERMSGSVTGPLVANKLYYRVDAMRTDEKRATDFWFNRTTNLSGSMVYKVSQDTQLSFEHEYTKKNMQGGQAFTRWQQNETVGGSTVTVTKGLAYYMQDEELGHRLTQYSSTGALSRVEREANSSYVTLEHRLASGLSLRANAAYTTRSYWRHGTSTPTIWTITPTTARQAILSSLVGTWKDTTRGIWNSDRSGSHQEIDYEEKGIQIDLTKKWETKLAQRSLLTFDVFSHDQDQKTWALSGTALNTALSGLGLTTTAQQNAWKNPDPFNPDVSGYLPNPAFDPATWSVTASSTNYFKRFYYGSLLNHTIDFLNGRMSWTGSVRYDWAEFQVVNDEGNIQKSTYNTGLNFHVIPRAMVAYANIATGFNPAPQFDPNTGELLGNQESTGGEIGVKGLLNGDSFSYTLGIYQVEQENEVTDNPDNPTGSDPDLPRYVPGAATRARGINLDMSGKVTQSLTLLGNISWTDVEIVRHASIPSLIGTRPTGTQGVPGRTYSLAGRYNFREGFLKGFRLGLTYQYAQSYLRTTPTYNTAGIMTMESYSIDERKEWGAVAGYSFRKMRNGARIDLSVNVANLFDDQKLTVAAYYPNGRTVRFTGTIRF